MSVISVAVSESEQIEDTITNSTQQQLLRTQVHFVSDALFFFQYAQGSFQESGVVASLGVTVLFFFFVNIEVNTICYLIAMHMSTRHTGVKCCF